MVITSIFIWSILGTGIAYGLLFNIPEDELNIKFWICLTMCGPIIWFIFMCITFLYILGELLMFIIKLL